MAASQLPVASDSGGQSTTASPQNSAAQAGAGLAGQSASGIQQNASSSLNTSGSGSVSLNGSPLTTVDLNATTQSSQQQPTTIVTKAHHVSPVLLGVAVLFLLIAIAATISFTRSAKNTTL